jgi:isocitrate lyase
LGIDTGIIGARTDSLGAGLTQKVPVSIQAGDLGSKYNDFLDTEVIEDVSELQDGDITIRANGKLAKPKRLDNGLYAFKEDTGFDRVVLDCITSLEHGNSPSFNWTLKFREQVYTEWQAEGKDLSGYPNPAENPMGLMDAAIDGTELSDAADALVRTFQADAAREAGIFHHLITLPTYHTAALSTDVLSEGYFGDLGMLAYVRDVQRQEIRKNLASVKHQDLAGSNVGDDHKEYFLGEKALLAGGTANTMNQF